MGSLPHVALLLVQCATVCCSKRLRRPKQVMSRLCAQCMYVFVCFCIFECGRKMLNSQESGNQQGRTLEQCQPQTVCVYAFALPALLRGQVLAGRGPGFCFGFVPQLRRAAHKRLKTKRRFQFRHQRLTTMSLYSFNDQETTPEAVAAKFKRLPAAIRWSREKSVSTRTAPGIESNPACAMVELIKNDPSATSNDK